MDHKTVHTDEIKYLVLHRGLMLNEVELEYGKIYDSEMFVKVPQHTLIGMVLGGWIYRGSPQEVERVRKTAMDGTLGKIDKRTTEPDKNRQIKEIKRASKESLKESG